MGKKLTGWKTKGMNQDLSVSAFNSEFAFENMNMRLSTNEGNTLLSWVNERGTEKLTATSLDGKDYDMQGEPVGTAVLNYSLIVFVTDGQTDYIHRFWFEDGELKGKMLYSGILKFNTDNPLETLVSYEADNVQKVYWTDGVNQPRVINIEGDYGTEGNWKDPRVFDFVPKLDLNEVITVKKILGGGGMFAPGVIQYAFTYYNKYGQESNIFHTTPLLYISHADRGAAPDEKVDNAFKITVSDIDEHFDYLRIYSIQRTSLNGEPICKRVQDISLQGVTSVSYTDTGYSGDSIDPTELLYKGGEIISAGTIEQKDGTLFLGNIGIKRERVKSSDYTYALSGSSRRSITPTYVSSDPYSYSSQLTAVSGNNTVPCGGFKFGEYYQLGVQFQHESGKWSEPCFLTRAQSLWSPEENMIPILTAKIKIESTLTGKGYKKARPVVVFPSPAERMTLMQGVTCPTLYTNNNRNGLLHAQSSWFFRAMAQNQGEEPNGNYIIKPNTKTVRPQSTGTLPYLKENVTGSSHTGDPSNCHAIEVQGKFGADAQFNIDTTFCTFHSPELIFDEQTYSLDYSSLGYRVVGTASPNKTLSDISIQTETPTIGSGGGFVHKSFIDDNLYGIVSGAFYDDFIVKDFDDIIGKWSEQKVPVKWMVYLWNKTGSLNNDINRPADKGVASAILKKKVISNLRYAERNTYNSDENKKPKYPTYAITNLSQDVGLFSSEEADIIKVGGHTYMGNIDTVLTPNDSSGMLFAFKEGTTSFFKELSTGETPYNNNVWWKVFALKDSGEKYGLYHYNPTAATPHWDWCAEDIGNTYPGLVRKKDFVRMKYKSTPHLAISRNGLVSNGNNTFNVIDIGRSDSGFPTNPTPDQLREYNWVPCGESVPLNGSTINLTYSYGDTYYQRWDCLKTYPFTPEDENQVVEIGSFMLETYVNIDGRYDRNRGQMNNLNMTPKNFNLLNPVYSQVDNFFTYKILDDKFYETTKYPNQITWSKTKQSSADVDMWTNVTLGSVLELDGDKGSITALKRFDNQLIAFQDTGISQILYNENTQISTTNGVPIEIANSGKVQGKRYISNTIGCSNKWSIAQTPSGLYFMDSHEKGIYLFAGQLMNLSVEKGFNTWCKKNIPSPDVVWEPHNFPAFVSYYDKQNQDVLFINDTIALAYSEKVGAFTSFYNYGCTPYFCNLDDMGVWVRGNSNETELWRHQTGDKYCRFFDTNYGYSMTLVGNPEPQLDKIFTNLEFRANVEGDGEYNEDTGKFTPALPFDQLEVWNEYQHGRNTLSHKTGHSAMVHYPSTGGLSLKRKFRIWRCDIPRDNMKVTEAVAENEKTRGIYRIKEHPIDRMRNTWLYLKLSKNAEVEPEDEEPVPMSDKVFRTEVHDILMTYFG